MREETEDTQKAAWIDEEKKVIYFTDMPGTRCHTEAESRFWEHVKEPGAGRLPHRIRRKAL